jgi:hypothetical protein
VAVARSTIYVRKAGLGGHGGITAKQIGEYFGVSTSSISQKVFDIDDDILEMDEEKIAAVSDMGGMFVDTAEGNEAYRSRWYFPDRALMGLCGEPIYHPSAFQCRHNVLGCR